MILNNFSKALGANHGTCNRGWDVEAPNKQLLLEKSLTCEFSATEFPYTLTDKKNSFRSPQRSLEIYGNNLWRGESRLNWPINFSLRVSRIALLQVIAFVATKLSNNIDNKPGHLENKLLEMISGDIELLEEHFSMKRLSETIPWDQPCTVTEKGPSADMPEIYARESRNYFDATSQVESIIEKYFDTFLRENPSAHKIKIPHPEDRKVAISSGGNASGKGNTTDSIIIFFAEEYNISSSDIVIVNTDSYKPFLIDIKQVAPKLYSPLSTDEASLVNAIIQNRLERAANISAAPHVIHDQVFAGQEAQLSPVLDGGGAARIVTVSTDVVEAVPRSHDRGMLIGRIETTPGILGSHKSMAIALPKDLSKYGGRDLTHTLVDNNQPPEIAPEVIMETKFKRRSIFIYNEEKTADFAKKTIINTDARSPDEVYVGQPPPSVAEYLLPFIQNRFFLFYCLPTLVQKLFFSPEYLSESDHGCKVYKVQYGDTVVELSKPYEPIVPILATQLHDTQLHSTQFHTEHHGGDSVILSDTLRPGAPPYSPFGSPSTFFSADPLSLSAAISRHGNVNTQLSSPSLSAMIGRAESSINNQAGGNDFLLGGMYNQHLTTEPSSISAALARPEYVGTQLFASAALLSAQ